MQQWTDSGGQSIIQSNGGSRVVLSKGGQVEHEKCSRKCALDAGFWASVLCLSGSYGDLLSYCTFASLLFYIITVAGVMILRKREPEAERPYKVWGYPYLPIAYLFLAGFVAVGILVSQFNIAMTGIGIVALGWPIYRLFQRQGK